MIFSAGIGLIEASSITSIYPYPDASDNDLIELYSGVLPAPLGEKPAVEIEILVHQRRHYY